MTPADHGADSGPGPDAAPEGPPDPWLARLLCWYPRAWRERYGEEFLALVEDTLDGRRPGWRLHLSVARSGLRERARQVIPSALRRMKAETGPPPPVGLMGIAWPLLALSYLWSVQKFTWIPLPAQANRQGWGAVPADAMAGLGVIFGVAVAGSGLAAGPAFARFLRAGGWPAIKRPVTRAAGVTAMAAGALTRLFLLARPMTSGPAPKSWAYSTSLIAALALLGAALLLWRQAAKTIARRLELRPGVRAVQIMLNTVARITATGMPPVVLIWNAQTRSDYLTLGVGVWWLVIVWTSVPSRLWQAWHWGQQLRTATAGPGGAAE
jgi:hypothetical protein